MRDKIHRFIAGLALELTEACATAVLQDSVDISQIQAFSQNIERGPGESSQASSLQRQRGSGKIWPYPLRCAICGRGHLGQCRASFDACYTCGHPGHMMRDYPNRDYGGMVQPENSTLGSSMFVHPSGRESQSSASRG
uniref:Uncharacterized protein LOC104247917 n=1 Tax=Nicotiana sylvestris TaxID=4096 RepID=A0A1U7YGV3_NICSY|nr:PREDICTED: uncharacterized protein LOC104247917 [Nicotiana sylvestris]